MKKQIELYKNSVLREIKYDFKKYILSRPVNIKIIKDEKFFYIENDNLSIIAFGETKEEALEEFSEHIMHFYNYYKNISNEKLTNNALKLKKIYIKLFLE